MPADVIVLNGVSSSGKTSIAAELACRLPRPFLRFGVDTLVDALPPSGGIEFGADGSVATDERFRTFERAWYAGLAAIARGGVGVIVDEVFLGGHQSQARLADALQGLSVWWVGVHCDPDVATAREARRPDRMPGMAALQAGRVHRGVRYDVEVDTSTISAAESAVTIARSLLS